MIGWLASRRTLVFLDPLKATREPMKPPHLHTPSRVGEKDGEHKKKLIKKKNKKKEDLTNPVLLIRHQMNAAVYRESWRIAPLLPLPELSFSSSQYKNHFTLSQSLPQDPRWCLLLALSTAGQDEELGHGHQPCGRGQHHRPRLQAGKFWPCKQAKKELDRKTGQEEEALQTDHFIFLFHLAT
ncbi:hypothetical protein I7I53_08502 [Histoplasma capsulatum var. duboisii H88]|uniref:Uncharacterized protein n=1 Tax=Ajellomyces capsulatus (strain H88) TaxID=544711 RepID=A0A8A1LGX9_AJEC8|nr:hypothetical protein I7I53_08502 [Histoplasma capsulatum var. duboisii H88]